MIDMEVRKGFNGMSIYNFSKKGELMKRNLVFGCLIAFLVLLMFCSIGCTIQQPGETAAEGHRRHIRNVRLQNQEFMQDVDTVLMTDEPSELSDKHIP